MKTKEHKESNGCEKYYCWRYALYKINFWTILKKLLQKNDFRRFPLFEIFALLRGCESSGFSTSDELVVDPIHLEGCPPHFQKQVGRGNRLQSTSLQQLKHWCSLWRTGTSCNAQVDQVEQLEQGKVLQAVQQGTGSAAVETVRQSAQLLEKCF